MTRLDRWHARGCALVLAVVASMCGSGPLCTDPAAIASLQRATVMSPEDGAVQALREQAAATRHVRPGPQIPALCGAAAAGDLAKLKHLLAAGAHVDLRDRAGRTALMFAAMLDRVGVVEYLLARGADPNARDGKGDTVLAAGVGVYAGPTTVAALVKAGARTESRVPPHHSLTAIGVAVLRARVGVARALLHLGADPDPQGWPAGWSLIEVAAVSPSNRHWLVRALLTRSARISQRHIRRALRLAVGARDRSAVGLLRKALRPTLNAVARGQTDQRPAVAGARGRRTGPARPGQRRVERL